VRISATDWTPRGNSPEDGLKVAAMFRGHGANIIDVSAGMTSRWANPVYGRMFQTPFSEMIRNEVGVPTIAVGNITTADQINTIIAAGRADLCALARPHLTNPHFTLVASAEYGYDQQIWPSPYLAGKDQVFRLYQRQQGELQALRLAAKPSSHDQRREVKQAAE
jgi:anthraniloyl-CoA monooxygenase